MMYCHVDRMRITGKYKVPDVTDAENKLLVCINIFIYSIFHFSICVRVKKYVRYVRQGGVAGGKALHSFDLRDAGLADTSASGSCRLLPVRERRDEHVVYGLRTSFY